MPRYDYRCPKCGYEVELDQKLSDRTPPVCTESDCNIDMDRVISKTSFQLKGSCWARDGYSSGKK